MTGETSLQEAITLVREGRQAEARRILENLLRVEQANETAWLWYVECVETAGERVQALERCLRHNPGASRARAALDLLRDPRPGQPAADPAADQGQAAFTVDPVFYAEIEFAAAADSAPVFELTPEDEWLLSGGAEIFTVSPDALTPEELSEMAARTEAFLAETRHEIPHRRPLRGIDWQELEQVGAGSGGGTSGSGFRSVGGRPIKRRKPAPTEVGFSRATYTTLTALAVVILMILALCASIVLRGI